MKTQEDTSSMTALAIPIPTGDFPDTGSEGVVRDVGKEAREELAAFVLRQYETAKSHRENNGVDDLFLDALHQARSEYSPKALAQLRAEQYPEVFIPITDTKIRALLSRWDKIMDRDDIVEMKPSDVPELPPDAQEEIAARGMQAVEDFGMVYLQATGLLEQIPPELMDMLPDIAMETGLEMVPETHGRILGMAMGNEYMRKVRAEAAEAARKMTKTIRDQLGAGGFRAAFRAASSNAAVYGTGFMRGPVPDIERRIEYVKRGGKTVAKMKPRQTMKWSSVVPWDVYPAPGALTVDDGDLCVKVTYPPVELREFADKGVDGWIAGEIDAALSREFDTGTDEKDAKDAREFPLDRELQPSYDESRRALTWQSHQSGAAEGFLTGIEFFGNLPGHMLAEMGITEDAEGHAVGDNQWLQVNAIVMRKRLVYLRLLDPGEARPYSKAVCYEQPGAFWGLGVPAKMAHAQAQINMIGRGIAMDIAHTSAPQMVVDDWDRIINKHDIKMKPFKMWSFRNTRESGSLPMRFIKPPSTAYELIAQLDRFVKQADEDTGIASVMHGASNMSGAAARTAYGLSVVVEGSEVVLTHTARNLDDGFLKPAMTRMYNHNMVYSRDESIKCDASPVARGYFAVVLDGQELGKYMELLAMLKGDPVVLGSILTANPSALVDLYRKVFARMGLDPDEILPETSDEELKAIQQRVLGMMSLTQAQRDGAEAQQGVPDTAQMANDAGQLPGGGGDFGGMDGGLATAGGRSPDGRAVAPRGRPPQPVGMGMGM